MATDGRATIVLSAVDKTGAAFASAKRNILGLQHSAAGISALLGPILGGVGLIGSALSLLNFKSIVNGVDALNDLKDATGASIENISALEDVAARTGTQFAAVGTALVKFNAQLKEAKPGSGPAEVLKAIGLEAERLKALDPAEALRQTAVALAGYADDGNKARIVQELFGKSVREVAPFIVDLAAQGKLNATVTTAQADAAEKFNHQINELEKNVKDAARSIVGDMIPALNDFFAALEANKRSDGVFAGIRKQIEANLAADQLRVVVGELESLQSVIDKTGPTPFLLKNLAALNAEADALTKQALQAGDALKGFADKGKPLPKPGRPANEGGGKFLGLRAPDVPGKADTSGIDKARAEALANLRKVIDGRVKTIAEGLENERDLQRFHEDMARGLYSAGQQSLESFYAAQDKARQENLASVRKATDETIAARQEELNSPLLAGKGNRNARLDIEAQIEEARAKLRTAEREADQAGQLAAVERQRATEALRDDVAALDAQIRELGGDASAGNLLDIARQAAEAKRLLTQAEVDPGEAEARVQSLTKLLTVQQQFNAARTNLGKITDDAAAAEERLLRAADRNGAGLLETEQAVAGLRRKAVDEIEALIAKTHELIALNPGDTALVRFLRDLQLQAERTREQMDPTKLRLDAAATDIGGTLADGFGRALKNVRDIKSILADVGSQVFDIVNREIIVKPLATRLSNILKGAGGQGTGENILTSIFGLGKAGAGGAAPADEASKAISALTVAATGSADVLGSLPNLAAIPATLSIGALGTAAQIATQALLSMAGSAAAGAAGSSGIGLLGLGGLIGGGGGFGTGANFGNMDYGLFLHRGGIAGLDGSPTRYHSGGIAGLAPDEVPAILRRGEEVLTAKDPRHRNNAAEGKPVQQVTVHAPITISVAGQVDRRTTEQLTAAAARGARMAISRGTA